MKKRFASISKNLLGILLGTMILFASALSAFAAENEQAGNLICTGFANYTCDWRNGVYEIPSYWYDSALERFCADKYFAIDMEGHLFCLPQGAENRENGRGGTERFLSDYIGDFALLSGGIVIDRNGETVFDVADTDYDKIYSAECLDVGYVICSKDVNTFSDTSTHYYSVNIKDGTGREIVCNEEGGSADWHKTFGKDKGAFYLSNGFYFTWTYVKEDLVYTGFYDLINNQTFIPVPSADSVYKDQPTIKFDWSSPWYSDGRYFYCMSRKDRFSMICMKLDLNAGTVSEVILDEERILVDDRTVYASLGHGFIDFKDGTNHIAMYDMVNDRLYDTSFYYGEMQIVAIREDASILMKVKNEGGGRFIALMDAQNGNHVFEPLPYSNDKEDLGFQYNETAILTREDDNTYHLYDWNGRELKVFTIEQFDYTTVYRLAGDMVFSLSSLGGYDPAGAYMISEGKEITIAYEDLVSDIAGENSFLQFLDFHNGSYVFRFNGLNLGTEDAFLLANKDLSSWIRIGYPDFEKAAR